MERLKVQNYASLRLTRKGKPYTVVTDDGGYEKGLRLEGYLTTWNEVNENGQRWLSTAYDDNISTYFEGNGLNIPLDVMHQRDLGSLVGVVEECEKDERGLRIRAFVTAGAERYSTVKSLLDCGALQGFSNYGYVTDYNFENEVTLVVKSFTLISASLVDVPADTGGKFMANMTAFKGFTPDEKKAEGDMLQNEIGIYGISF